MNIALMGADPGIPNRGVGALAYGSFKALNTAFPESALFLLDYAKNDEDIEFFSQGRKKIFKRIPLRFSKKLLLKNNIAVLVLLSYVLKVIRIKKVHEFIETRFPCLQKIRSIDYCFALSGGDSFADIYGIQRFIYVSLPIWLTQINKKPVVFLPQTIGPFKNRVLRKAAATLMKGSLHIFARDHESVSFAKRLVGKKLHNEHISFCYDVGFLLEPAKPSAEIGVCIKRKKRPLVGLNVSGLLYTGGYTGNNQFGLAVDYKWLMSQLPKFLMENLDVDILLVPHVFGARMENDVDACREVSHTIPAEYKGRVSLVTNEFSAAEIKYVIGLCDFFIGSRMHACIAALSQNIPALPLAYSKKFSGVMTTLGLEKYVVDLRSAQRERVYEQILFMFKQRNAIVSDLKIKIPKIRASIVESLQSAVMSAPGNKTKYSRLNCLFPNNISSAKKMAI